MRISVRAVISIAITVVFVVSCKKEKTTNTSELPQATTTTVKSIVQVDFSGLIAQLAKQDSSTGIPKRAVVLRDNMGGHPHFFSIKIPEVLATETELKIIGATVDCDKDKKAGCEITDITDGIALSIAGMEPSPVRTTLTFDTLVPSLGEAYGADIAADKLHADLKQTTPPTPGGPFLAYFDFSGGELSAVGFCGHGAFKKTTLVQRRFAETVMLMGTTSADAELKVVNRRQNKTATFKFKHPDYIHIKITNLPDKAFDTDHFPLYNFLFDGAAGISLPEVDTTQSCKGKGTVVGCSDSSWP